MTKKHFIALANVIKALEPLNCPNCGDMFDRGRRFQHDSTVAALLQFCGEAHPNFNADRWLGYIAGTNGPNGGKVK